jgi:hypothetical protein
MSTSKFRPDVALPMLTSKFRPDVALPMLTSKFRPNVALPMLTSKFRPDVALPMSTSKFRPDVALPMLLSSKASAHNEVHITKLCLIHFSKLYPLPNVPLPDAGAGTAWKPKEPGRFSVRP